LPLAFALVFLSPLAAVVARLPTSVFVLVTARKNRGYKLAFNVSLLLVELLAAVFVYRRFLDVVGGGRAVELVAVAAALVAIAPFTSVLISVAISRFEGGARERIVSELRATWWMYTVNAVLSTMTVAMVLIEPALALLAALPVAGIWFVLHSYGELGQELRDLDAVHGFAGRIGRTLDVDEIAEVAADDISEALRAEGVAVVRFTDDGPSVSIVGTVPVDLPETTASPAWADLVSSGEVRIVERDELRALGVPASGDVSALMVAPVDDGGETLALVVVAQRPVQVHHFDDGDVARLRNMSQQLAVSLRRGMLHERLEFEARHDALTGLPARTLFEREVGAAVERIGDSPRSWVLMLDLDRFKEVNDTLGHHAGDDLLIQFAGRMSELLEPDDVLARLAGDEFAILCHRPGRADVVDFANRCFNAGGEPVILDELEIVVTVSVGVAQITPEDEDAVQPMRRADIAMYNAKWQRSGVEFYRDEIDRRTPARLSMLGDLRAAIEADDLDVVYQPKLELVTGTVVGVEALVRWEHAGRGVVAPSEFVRVAEDTGLIKQLTDMVLSRGIEMLRRFQDHGLSLGLAVNLSTHDLFDSRLPNRVQAYLDASSVPAGSLTLEITESSLFVDAPRTRATIDDLDGVGIRMAVDDFGTGYSSLSYLRRLPVNELKIDQSFVARMLSDPQDEVIVRSTIDLGHNLGLLVVAEGVESIPILDRLRDVGCDVAQGYCISEPLLADDLIAWLRRIDDARASGTPAPWVTTVG
jgi:diguanylate cyclase (GGDEF)-like protein